VRTIPSTPIGGSPSTPIGRHPQRRQPVRPHEGAGPRPTQVRPWRRLAARSQRRTRSLVERRDSGRGDLPMWCSTPTASELASIGAIANARSQWSSDGTSPERRESPLGRSASSGYPHNLVPSPRAFREDVDHAERHRTVAGPAGNIGSRLGADVPRGADGGRSASRRSVSSATVPSQPSARSGLGSSWAARARCG
jgi:hypothetical protein